jgi:hypothetical protein
MNKALTIAIVVILVVLAAGFAYGYASTNSKVTTLTNKVSGEQRNLTQLNEELSVYTKNSKTLSQEVNNSTSLSVLENAYSHWDSISIENVSLMNGQYMNNATLTWIGGPLSGNYSGINSIDLVWTKFFGIWGAVWFYTPTPPTVSLSGNTSIVSAQVQFLLTAVKTPLQVQFLNISYALEYQSTGGTWYISHEVWQIVASGTVSYPTSQVTSLEREAVMGYSFSHWNSIAIENVSLIMQQYYSGASLLWIGGPLSGTYNYSQIPTVWGKFSHLWQAVWYYSEAPPSLSISGSNYYVNATVQWVLTSYSTPLQVNDIITNYSLEYTVNGSPQIVKETWRIISASTISYTSKSYEALQSDAIGNAAFAHWNDIAIENASLTMSQYLNNSTLQWIGGKLSGNYTNSSDIGSVWSKFFSIWNAVWFYSEAPPILNATSSGGVITGGTVTADIQFVVQSSSNLSQFSYIDVVYTIHFVMIGGNFYIASEIFDNVQSGPLSQVGTFS